MKVYGLLTVLGSFIIHCMLGSCYSWGGLSLFYISYFRHFDGSISVNDGFFIMPIIIFTNALTVYLGAVLEKKMSPRLVILLGFFFYTGGYLVYYIFVDSLTMLYVGVAIAGIGIGIAYLPPLKTSWKYFPDYKGAVTGVILFGFGCSGFLFNTIGASMINPNGTKPTIDGKYYDKEITDNVPTFTIVLISLLGGCGIIGSLLVFPTEKEHVTVTMAEIVDKGSFIEEKLGHHREEFDFSDSEEFDVESGANNEIPYKKIKEEESELNSQLLIRKSNPAMEPFKVAFCSREFLYCTIMGFSTLFYPYSIVNLNKQFGLVSGVSESFLVVLVSVFTIINGGIRAIFGYAMDKVSFRVLYSGINITIIIVSSTIYFAVDNDILYFIYNILSAMCLGGHFSCFAAYMPKKFGLSNSTELYGFLFMTYGFSSVLGAVICKFVIKEPQDYLVIFLVGAGFAAISLVFTLLLKNEKFSYKAENQNNDTSIQHR